MLASPVPPPDVPSPKPRPVSATAMSSRPSRSRASMRIRPPSGSGLSPCLSAFSTSVSSIIGGTVNARSAGGMSISKASRCPMRIFCTLRNASIRTASRASVDVSSRIRGRATSR